jgi:1-acyl-sn-glycerol-3-phosphate acyltransferase
MTSQPPPRPYRLRLLLSAALRLAYTLWAVLVFLAVGLVALIAMLALPGIGYRRAAGHYAARTLLTLIGLPLTVKHAERLPAGQCVVVCNHASYLDGPVVSAALPPRFAFVIKREMSAVPLAGMALRLLGSEFVERHNRSRSSADARRLLHKASRGVSLVFFPEGTFDPRPGVHKFHTGAFASAVRAGCPVVPAVLRGTRRALWPGSALARPGPVELEVLTPLTPAAGAGSEAVPALRDAARAAILAALGEPDLTCCDDTARPPDTAPARSARASRP